MLSCAAHSEAIDGDEHHEPDDHDGGCRRDRDQAGELDASPQKLSRQSRRVAIVGNEGIGRRDVPRGLFFLCCRRRSGQAT